MPLLSIKNLSFEVHGRQLLSDVSLELSSGDFVLLAGRNGAGKSTLLKCMAFLEENWTGLMVFQDQDLRGMTRRQRAKGMAYLPQRLDSLPDFSVLHFMRICRYAWHDNDDAPIHSAAEALGVTALMQRGLDTLSGGELQKVLIASALAQGPSLMLLDEPTSSLDPVQKRDMASLLQRLSKDRNMAVLMVSHDVQTCAEQVDYVLPMRCGRLLPSQRPAAFLAGMDAVYGDV